MTKTIVILYNTSFYVYKFRVNLIRRLIGFGYRVVVVSPNDEYVEKLTEIGVTHVPINMSQYGMNPFSEIVTTYHLYRLLKEINPVCSLHYTIKPNIFGGIAAGIANVAVINNIAGAGRAFSEDHSLFSRFIGLMYKIGLKKSKKIFFQNDEDMRLFVDRGLVNPVVAERIPGSGVDLIKYPLPEVAPSRTGFKFLFVGRLLKEKGIVEYLDAAVNCLEESNREDVTFDIVGEIDDSGACVQVDQLHLALTHPGIHYHGAVSPDTMPSIISSADCVVLPSYYREGVPRSLLEACAMGKPIITTDNVGCRDVIDDGINGFKVPVRDSYSLKVAMLKMMSLPHSEREKLGRAGRDKVVSRFDENIVLDAYVRAIDQIVGK